MIELKEIQKAFPGAEEIEISDKGRWSTWGESGSFTVDGEEWNWIEGEATAEDIAREYVKEQLESEPELFTKDWLKSFLGVTGTDARVIALEMAEIAFDGKEYDEDEYADYADDVEARILKDPFQYFVEDEGLYTEEDLMKQNFMYLDVRAAAKDAVDVDGWAHFLSTYDGDFKQLPSGIVIFRE